MPTKVLSNSNFVSGFSAQSLGVQSILDIFVIQGLISHNDAEKLKRTYRTNREVERILLTNKIVSRETINKAYSILLKLPYISLDKVEIDEEILGIIPQKAAERFGIVAFGLKDKNLQVAVSRPADLSASFTAGLEEIIKGKPYKIELFITGTADFDEAIKQYRSKSSPEKLSTGSLPVVYLRNQKIPNELLRKLPLDFVQKHRAVFFYQKSDKTYAMALERADDSQVRRAVQYIENENKIKIQLFAASQEDIDYTIAEYKKLLSSDELAKKEELQAKEVAADKNKEQEVLKNKIEEEKRKQEEERKQKEVEKQRTEAEKARKEQENFSISGLFSGFKNKNSAPALTIDTLVVNKGEPIDNKPNAAALKDPAEESEISDSTNKTAEPEGSEPGNAASPRNAQASAAGNRGNDEMEIGSLLERDIESIEDLKKVLSEQYIPKVVAAIINYALSLRASDIHVESGAKDLRIRYRIDGILRDMVRLPLALHPPMISRIKILSKMKIDETRIPQDGRFDVKFKNREVDVRVSALPTVHGEKIVMRILDKDQGVLSLEDLGMMGRGFELTVESIAKPYGIILSTGPTGSGKSTTLYAILNRISTPSVNIITLEDPVEYEIPGVNQCQIKPSIGFTFAEGLRSVLRQDPNVVMVGEIRDGETAAMATHAALTGHLVLSTLHTNDASGALPRLINMGIEPFLITSSINEIIAQRLIRRICPKCKEEIKMPPTLIDEIKRELDDIPKNNQRDLARIKPDMKFYHGVGCDDCNQGYRGRLGIFEVLRVTEMIEEMAIGKKSANEIKSAAVEDGMITMRQDGILKCLEGITTIDEVFRATAN